MLTRRGFMAGTLGGGMLVSAEALLRTPQALARPANLFPSQESGRGQSDWAHDSRWGLDYWRANNKTVEWPNKARIAYLCSVPFEAYDPGASASDFSRRRLDSASVSQVLYGGKVGVWRIMDILDRHGIKGSFIFNSIAAVLFPDAVKAIADRGHELIAHFWANNIREDSINVEQDREFIEMTFSLLEEVAGKAPIAWVAPGWEVGPKTLEIVAEQGQQVHANSPDSDDLPYTVQIAGKKMLVIPHTTLLNDFNFIRKFNPPSTYLEVLKNDFDRKYAEGASSPGMFNFVIHAQLCGRPFMADALDEILSYGKSFPEIWFTTRQEIMDWWIQRNYL